MRDEDFEGGAGRGFGERVTVLADEERTGRSLALPVAADGLGCGQDVVLVEGSIQR